MSRDDIIEQAAQVLSTLTTCDGEPHATELHRRQARALADAGLLARPLPTREEIADTIYDALEVEGWVSTTGLYPYEVADAVLDLLKGHDQHPGRRFARLTDNTNPVRHRLEILADGTIIIYDVNGTVAWHSKESNND